MNKEIRIGKFTLESLTSGMYSDSKIIFREYIQNSSDAIDEAILAKQLANRDDGEIRIRVNKKKHTISIRDNGLGISQTHVASKLCDIGNSAKRFEESRGFRGIGRLGGLSYCGQLKFVTSFKGEPAKSSVCWDCAKLKSLLQPGKHESHDLSSVISEVVTISSEEETCEAHYFEVILSDVDHKYPELMDIHDIYTYLSQVAPIPFNAQKFPYYSDKHEGIKKLMATANKPLEEYNIYINDDPNPIYKPYKTWLTTSRGRDDITQVKHFIDYNDEGQILFLGWYGISKFQGHVQDREIAGFRVRKNNIQIGDEKTLDAFFTEDRFNRWFIGEIYIYDPNIIPNARRDDFEKNESYFYFRPALSG
jgi:molecular chaperone HtpG